MRQQEEAEKFGSLFFLLPPSSKLVAWWRAVLCTELVYVLTILIIDIYTNNCMNVFLPNIVVLDLGSSSLGSFSVLVTNLPNTQLIPPWRSTTLTCLGSIHWRLDLPVLAVVGRSHVVPDI